MSRGPDPGALQDLQWVCPVPSRYNTEGGSPSPAPRASPRKVNRAFQEGKMIFEIVIEKNSQIPRENNFSSGSISDHTPESFL